MFGMNRVNFGKNRNNKKALVGFTTQIQHWVSATTSEWC